MGIDFFTIYFFVTFFCKFSEVFFLTLQKLASSFLWLSSFDYSNQAENIDKIRDLVDLFFPYLLFILLLELFHLGLSRARKRKAGIIILASFIQMFLPDPYAERTIKVVQVQKERKTNEDSESSRKKPKDKSTE